MFTIFIIQTARSYTKNNNVYISLPPRLSIGKKKKTKTKMAVITDNSGVEVKIDLLNSFSGNNNVMTNHTQFDPASRTGTANAKPELDLDVENQDEAEDNGDDAALSLRRNRLLKKGLAASCGAAVVAAAFVIGAEWTASTMVSKSSVIEPASQVVNKNKSYSPKSSKSKS